MISMYYDKLHPYSIMIRVHFLSWRAGQKSFAGRMWPAGLGLPTSSNVYMQLTLSANLGRTSLVNVIEGFHM